MLEIKRSKKNVLLASVLIFLLSTTTVALQITPVATIPVHDVAVTNIDVLFYNATVVYLGWHFNVTVKNYGTETETFKVYAMVHIGNDILDMLDITVEGLGPGENETLTFNWADFSGVAEIWPYPEYDIWAYAQPVPGDANLSNNELTSNATVRWPGDATGDGHINEADLEFVADYYNRPNNTWPGANYTALADFDCDGDITFYDIMICTANFHDGPCDLHDVAVTGIFPVTYPTWNDNFYLTFGVTVQNRGWHYPENVTVTLYNGTNPIGTKTVTNLASRAEKLITFTLEGQQSLPGYPNNSSAAWPYCPHTVWANVSSEVPGEWDTADNTYGNVTVTVRWPGDAYEDGHVNQTDKDRVMEHLGSEFPDLNYTALVDFNIDGIVNDTDLEILENKTHWHNGPIDYCDLGITLDKILFIPGAIALWNPRYIYPDWELQISVIAKNNGNNTETDFTLTAYANTAIIGTQDFNVNLAPSANTTVSFPANIPIPYDLPQDWPYPYPVYNITVGLTLPCDDNSDNDEDSYGIVTVWCPGDTNGDGYLDETDLSNVSKAIKSYRHYADFNGSGEIDLDDVQQLIHGDRWRQGPRRPDPDPAKKKL